MNRATRDEETRKRRRSINKQLKVIIKKGGKAKIKQEFKLKGSIRRIKNEEGKSRANKGANKRKGGSIRKTGKQRK